METQTAGRDFQKPSNIVEREAEQNRTMKRLLLILNCILLSLGTASAPLIMRLYFIHGGKRIWLSSWLETGGFPVIFIPLAVSYFHCRRHSTSVQSPKTQLVYMKPPLFFASVAIGLLTGVDNYIYAYGLARLPVSTSSLLIATQLAFTAGFAFLLVRQKFTAYSINAVVLLTIGAAVLALHTTGDRPAGESTKQYVLGFVLTLAAAALYGFILPLVELVYNKSKQTITYTLVMEIQLIMCVAATLFCTVGMLINNDFKVIFYLGKFYFDPTL